jgi:hypothetical protein
MELLKRLVRRSLRPLIRACLAETLDEQLLPRGVSLSTRRRADGLTTVDKGMQILLTQKYRELARRGDPLPRFDEVEFRAFSQTTEDGILLFLFAVLGTVNKRSLELCAGNGIECNSANLIVNHNWTGALVDGNRKNIELGQRFYAECTQSVFWMPTLRHAWVTAENVNELAAAHACAGDMDLFSLDMDGMDYWVWKALTCCRPRVVVAEYECSWGPGLRLSRPYRPDFRGDEMKGAPQPAGASLAALVALGKEKGYRLVGCNSLCFNAFFLRDDVGTELFPEVPVASCFHHPACSLRYRSQAQLRKSEWVTV